MLYRLTIEQVPGFPETRREFTITCDDDETAQQCADTLTKLGMLSVVVSVKLEEPEHV